MPTRIPIRVDQPGTVVGEHLFPVIDAELRWGNAILGGRREFHYENRQGYRFLGLRDPLHVERLYEEFEFPPGVVLRRHLDGSTILRDTINDVTITGRPAPPPVLPQVRDAALRRIRRLFGQP